jgi:hypothetical protein
MSRFVFNRRTSATFAAAFFTAPLSRARTEHGPKGMDAPRAQNRERERRRARTRVGRPCALVVIDIRNPVCDCIINEIRICPAVQLIYARVHLHDSTARARGYVFRRRRRRRAQTACKIHLVQRHPRYREQRYMCACRRTNNASLCCCWRPSASIFAIEIPGVLLAGRAALWDIYRVVLFCSCCLMCSKALCTHIDGVGEKCTLRQEILYRLSSGMGVVI